MLVSVELFAVAPNGYSGLVIIYRYNCVLQTARETHTSSMTNAYKLIGCTVL